MAFAGKGQQSADSGYRVRRAVPACDTEKGGEKSLGAERYGIDAEL